MATVGAVGGSQIDVQTLVSQLVAAERARPEAQIERDTGRVTTQISALGQLMGSLATFRSSLSSLQTVGTFSTRAVKSTNEDVITASVGGGAVPGSYDIDVESVAQAHQISSNPFVGGGTTVVGTGALTLSMGGKSFTVDIADGKATLADIRNAINSANDNIGVRATLVQGTTGTRLVLSSSTTGAANTISVTQSGGNGGLAQLTYGTGNTANYTQVKQAQDAVIYIAGERMTSASNTIDNAIDGLTLTVKKPTTVESGPATLNVTYDSSAVTTRVKSFVTAYNALVAQIGKLRSYDATTKTAGPMLGDSLLTSIESELRRTVSGVVPDQAKGFETLAAIGITTQLDGTLGIDDAKLQKALGTNFESVGKLFGSEDGIARKLFAQIDARLKTGGALDTRNKTLTDQQRAIEKRKDDLDVRMAAVQQNYLQQFTRLDTLLSQLQVTSSYLTQQIESLGNLNKASSR
jgi:flagellar hook-associated protein 2